MKMDERMPDDFMLRWNGDHLTISGTCKTTRHLEALAEAILVFRGCLPSTREAVAGDLFLDTPERPWSEQIAEFLGDTAGRGGRSMPVMPRQFGGLARAEQRRGAKPGLKR